MDTSMPMGEAVLSIPKDPPDRGHAVSTKDILVMSTVLGVPYAHDRSCCAADPVTPPRLTAKNLEAVSREESPAFHSAPRAWFGAVPPAPTTVMGILNWPPVVAYVFPAEDSSAMP